ncbi:MFS transporter [Actinacidiphila bryophytorum]|uniref:MFS family arabinose efflux permease n=1 Tax=Actinacidiphila bryophytorum TaxID=1436133 RepID=A0A9W4H8B3_9ACTN|nr:MFS transporter [Actinacidiphila bryophytorum]MBM9438250.1 MFS transporter [Actinacidiphila bryophytorum]MBN6542964.1 MFS transporter [Actinacidiphila bryophytorum]CAG7657763.1 Putative MFS family arabinose efflux permease [Actinacidiphila bryophytorum]
MTTLSGPRAAAGPAAARPPRALLLVLCASMLIDALEVSVVLPALPVAARHLGLSLWGAQWVMSGFALGFAALLLLGPRLTARYGARRPYLWALLVFAAASVVGGTTGSATVLVATRVVKGACAALTAPTGLAIIAGVYPEGAPRRRAVTVYSLFGAAGFTSGILLSGALTSASWRWTLLFPAPVALVLLLVAARQIPREAGRTGGSARGRAGFRGLLGNAALVRSAVGAACLNGGFLGLLLLTVFGLQDGRGWSPWATALGLLPACAPLALSAPFAGRLIARAGPQRLIAAGALAAAVAYTYQLMPWHGRDYPGVLPSLVLVGAAFVLSFTALNVQATSAMSAAERPVAVPLYQTGVQAGAALALVLTAALRTAARAGWAPYALLTGVGAAGLLVALAGLRPAVPDDREDPA